MNDRLFRTILKRYEAEIEDALYKIQCIEDHNMVIPDHTDITGEIDKLLGQIGKAEEKLSVMRKYCVENKADKPLLQPMYMYGKKNKKKIKNYSRNNVILSLWSISVGITSFRVDTRVDTLCVR